MRARESKPHNRVFERTDRRDACIVAKLLMLLETHSGDRTCNDLMRDEALFNPLNPYSFVQIERDIRLLALQQRNRFREVLQILLDYPDYKPETCLKFGSDSLPEGVNEAFLFSGKSGQRYILAVTDDDLTIADKEGRFHSIRREREIPYCWAGLLKVLRT